MKTFKTSIMNLQLQNTKAIKIIVTFFFICLVSAQLKAQYTLTDADVSVDKSGRIQSVSYNFAVKNIIIPDTLDGYAVKEILWGNFEEVGLMKIKLPSTLEVIGDYAFIHNQIESIEMPDSSYIKMGVACFNDNLITEINGNPSDGFIYAKNSDGTNDSTTIVSYGGGETIVDFIPANATTIGYFAFAENELSEVVIPNTITQIDAAAFNLNTVSKINGLATDGIVFARKADGSEDSTTIVSYCGSTTHIDFIPSTVSKIGEEAFSSSELTSVDIPANVDTIEYGGFYANSITNVTFTEGGNLKYIGLYAFYYNSGLTLTLPTSNYINFSGWFDTYRHKTFAAGSSVSTAYAYAAYLPYTLTDADVVMRENNIVSYTNTDGHTAISIPDTLNGQAVIGVRAGVLEDKGVVMVYLPTHSSLTDFNGWLNFNNNAIAITNGKYLVYDFDITYIANLPTYTLTSMDVIMNNNTLKSCNFPFVITNVNIPETLAGQVVKALGVQSFYEKGITAVQLPSTLEKIGAESLTRNLFSSIAIPASVTSIGLYAFYGDWTDINSYLSKITFEPGSRLKEIGQGAFNGCNNLTQIDLPDSIETIGEKAFYLCYLKSIYIPKSIKIIDENAFCNQGVGKYELTSVVFENNSNLEYIGLGAFANNLSLSDFTLPTSSLTNFKYWQCSGVGSVKSEYAEGETTAILTAQYIAQYPYTLKDADVVVKDNYIQSYDDKNVLSSYIIIPDTLDGQAVKGIKENNIFGPFSQYSILGIELPNTLEYIPAYAFWGTELSEIDLPQSVVFVGANAFKATSITEIELPQVTTTGFVGWINGGGNYVELTDTGYVATNLVISYTTAYKLLFKDYDGILLKTDTIKHYASAVPPTDPTRTGYTFTGWDIGYSNIAQGITVTAQYSQSGVNNYTVAFKDWDGTTISTQTVAENNAAIAPAEPGRTGYAFTGWDVDFSKITSDLTVTAQYTPITGIENAIGNNIIKMYPNPLKNILVIEIKNLNLIKNTAKGISIFNCAGQIIYHSQKINTKQEINISNYPNGIYLVSIGNETKKIIKN